jgi:hypothetical protein
MNPIVIDIGRLLQCVLWVTLECRKLSVHCPPPESAAGVARKDVLVIESPHSVDHALLVSLKHFDAASRL